MNLCELAAVLFGAAVIARSTTLAVLGAIATALWLITSFAQARRPAPRKPRLEQQKPEREREEALR